MSSNWNAEPIHLSPELSLNTAGSADGVSCGKTINGIYASDLVLTPAQARAYAANLLRAADVAEQAGAQS